MSDDDVALKFEKIATRWMEESRLPRTADVPDHVYHYTDAAGLSGMLSSHSIWLTDHRFLNDKTEAAYMKALAREIIDKLEVSDPASAAFFERMRHWAEVRGNEDSYVFSLSQLKDDLSQWRGYAREGQGFTLGFDAGALHDLSRPSDASYSFMKVEYDQRKQRAVLDKIIKGFSNELRGLGADKSKSEENINAAAYQADYAVENVILLNKHRSFRSEQEWRIVTYCAAGQANANVRVSGLRLVPYVTLKPQGDKVAKLPITSIGIGPGFGEPEVVADAVRALAKVHGYKPNIYFADTPYRNVS